MSFNSLLTQRCSIFRHKEKKAGNITKQGEVLIAENVRCRSSVKSASNADTQGRIIVTSTHTLILQKNADIKNGDVVKLEGEKYKVTKPKSPNKHHITVVLEKEGEV